ncbi:Variant surface glycoprotein [Trypanosoma congolense IL3000]|uniref:Variant surface glycoprotein n=1 Tax=Trypanosoma congolense (strain IL3000) TaxID=1068625 RepID=F9W7Q1_TRYCI|nr:Variant surface glycoprotein [Trypanosoma congolense IL3000]
MCLELWKLLLMMVALNAVSLEAGGSDDDLFDKLCNMTKLASALVSMEGKSRKLSEAVYGMQRRGQFRTTGDVSLGVGCARPRTRNTLCTHYRFEPLARGPDGCFAESLLGTLLCICTPPESGQSSFFCHDKFGPSGSGWTGPWGQAKHNDLFKDLWNHVLQGCLVPDRTLGNTFLEIGQLEQALASINGSLKKGQQPAFLYLGKAGKTCAGQDAEDVCAAYPAGVGQAQIPWLKKIKEALEILQKLVHPAKDAKQASEKSYQEDVVAQDNQMEEADRAAELVIEENPQPQQKDNETEPKHEKKEDEKKTTVRHAPTERSSNSSKRKTVQDSPFTDLPHLAINPDDESSIILRPTLTILAALIY